MLDFRHETFLTLCSCGSYTKTADLLHITQPAVSQHIKYLEEYYGCKLFDSRYRKLSLTHQGERLKEFAMTIFSDTKHFKDTLLLENNEKIQFNFGATLSIGEYVMPDILSNLFVRYPNLEVHMLVSNTQILLDRLNNGELDFIIVEGQFDKSLYDSTLFSLEKFIAVCSKDSKYAYGTNNFDEIIESRIILREKGSGTREIFENILHKHNYTIDAFKQMIEIGNMSVIKKLVSNNLGITFLFEVVAKQEIDNGILELIHLPNFNEQREFNFVMLKNSFYKSRMMSFYSLLKDELNHLKK